MQLNIDGFYAEAEAKLRRELDLATDLPQTDHRMLWMRENLGGALIAQRNYREAAIVYRQNSDIIPPAGWGRTATRRNLATLLHYMKPVHDDAAIELAAWGLEQSLKHLGEDDPTTRGFKAKVDELRLGTPTR